MWVGLRRVIAWLIRIGGSPQHVAFIMDGNRRFADKQEIDEIGGHTEGYRKMVDAIHWCVELGVRHISVYAFSIDNFKRSANEVGSLMHLAEEKYMELAKENGLAEREGVEMRIVGDLSFCPSGVQGAAARLMQNTTSLKHCHAVLNICFSYTSSEELLSALSELHQGLKSGALSSSDINPQLLRQCLRTRQDSPPVDLLIRTSGESRLSDFMLWQVSDAFLSFIDVLWPDLTFCDVARCVLQYQASCLKNLGVIRATTPHQPSSYTTDPSQQSSVAAAGVTEQTKRGRLQPTPSSHQSAAAAAAMTEASEIDALHATAPCHLPSEAVMTEPSESDANSSPCCVSEDDQPEISMQADDYPAAASRLKIHRIISNTSTDSEFNPGVAFHHQAASRPAESAFPDDLTASSTHYTSSLASATSTASAASPPTTPKALNANSNGPSCLQHSETSNESEFSQLKSHHPGQVHEAPPRSRGNMHFPACLLNATCFMWAVLRWLIHCCLVEPALFVVKCMALVFRPSVACIPPFLPATGISSRSFSGVDMCECPAALDSSTGEERPQRVITRGKRDVDVVMNRSQSLGSNAVRWCSCSKDLQEQRQTVHEFFTKIDRERSEWIEAHVGL